MLTDARAMLEDAEIMLSPRERKRRIGRAIAKHRRLAGMSQEDLGRELATGQTTISAWEKGKNTPTTEVLDRLDELFSTGHTLTSMWDALSRESGGYAHGFADVVEIERTSEEIREYAPLYIPGLLQTERYARAVLSHGTETAEEAAELLTARKSRQDILKGESAPKLQFVVEEYILRRPLGGLDVLREQLERIQEIAELPRVSIQVVPMDSEEHPGIDGGFVLFKHPDKGMLAFTESRYTSNPNDDLFVTEGYMAVWADLRGAALPSSASVKLIRELARKVDNDYQ
jgi:transcriptional regulator with XRE-family HTH domain